MLPVFLPGIFLKTLQWLVGEDQEAEQEHEAGWWQKTKKAVDKIGLPSAQFLPAGGGLFMTLSNWGLLPQVQPPFIQTTSACLVADKDQGRKQNTEYVDGRAKLTWP